MTRSLVVNVWLKSSIAVAATVAGEGEVCGKYELHEIIRSRARVLGVYV